MASSYPWVKLGYDDGKSTIIYQPLLKQEGQVCTLVKCDNRSVVSTLHLAHYIVFQRLQELAFYHHLSMQEGRSLQQRIVRH